MVVWGLIFMRISHFGDWSFCLYLVLHAFDITLFLEIGVEWDLKFQNFMLV